MAKRNSIIQCTIQPSGVMTFSVVGVGSFDFDPAKCTDETERSATLHGYKQKISDKAAIQHDPETGKPATPREKFNAMKALADHLQGGGAWLMRAASTPSLNRAALFAAVATIFNRKAEDVYMLWQSKSDDELRLRLTHKDVAAEYARLTASGTEDESLFEGLDE